MILLIQNILSMTSRFVFDCPHCNVRSTFQDTSFQRKDNHLYTLYKCENCDDIVLIVREQTGVVEAGSQY
jgi:transcription elongation factor Elf1